MQNVFRSPASLLKWDRQLSTPYRPRVISAWKWGFSNRGRSLNGTSQNLYDLIIVGAGTAGSLLSYRMAERYPNKKILVLDVGQDDVRTNVETLAVPNPNNPFDPWGQLLKMREKIRKRHQDAFSLLFQLDRRLQALQIH